MIRSVSILALLLTGLLVSSCVYDLSIEGKGCDDQNPCPPGYTCSASVDGRVCTKGIADGGAQDGDGSDGGDDPGCQPGETRCSPDLGAIQTCTNGAWLDSPCAAGEYCLDTDQAAPACEFNCAASPDCPGDRWCNPDTAHCEPRGDCTRPGEDRCNPTLDAVIRCSPESGLDEPVQECTQDLQYCDPFDPSCKNYCTDDAQCLDQPDTTCEPNSGKCVPIGLCANDACPAGQMCVGESVCTPIPDEEASLPGGTSPALSCYVGAPSSPPDSPDSCDLQGRVVNFFNRQELPDAAGLTIRVHQLTDVLVGRLDNASIVTQALADGNGNGAQYSLSGVPTNTQLVLEVQGGTGQGGFDFTSMLTFGLYIRADDCVDGLYSFSAPAILEVNYSGYANPPSVLADPDRGLVFGQLRDCDGVKIIAGTGGVSMPTDLVYYLDDNNLPDPLATHTNASGFFIAANAVPIRGMAAALVVEQGVPISLRPRPVRVFPGIASLVVFDVPLDPDMP